MYRVVDNFLSEEQWDAVAGYMDREVRFKYWKVAGNTGSPVWGVHPDEVVRRDWLIGIVVGHLETLSGMKFGVKNININAQTMGLDGRLHDDSWGGECDHSLIYYPHRVWKPSWGGRLNLFDGVGGEVASILPMPNRAVFFRSDIPHLPDSPNGVEPGVLRTSIGFHMFRRGVAQ